MMRGIFSVGVLGLAAFSATTGHAFASARDAAKPGFICDGDGPDADASYRVLAYKVRDTRYERVVLQRVTWPVGSDSENVETLGDYTSYSDVTPAKPTDVVFRYIFSSEYPPASSFSVMLAEGGFTDQGTAKVSELSSGVPVVISDLTCVRQ